MDNRDYLPLTSYGTASIGDTIRALRIHNPLLPVEFDFCRLVPSGPVKSYRGYYDHVAIGWVGGGLELPTVANVLSTLESAIGRHHMGYKGGVYLCTSDTPLWIAQWGECTDTGICYVEDAGDWVILGTRRVSDDD